MTLLLVLAFFLLHPVFSEAREAAIESRRFDEGKRLAKAAKAYVDRHDGLLPGAGWTQSLGKVDPGLKADLWREQDGSRLGYAAVPGVLGRKLSDLSPDTILFVETRSGRVDDVVNDLSFVGGRLRRDTVVAITVKNVMQRYPEISMQPLVRVGVQLAKQGATGLK